MKKKLAVPLNKRRINSFFAGIGGFDLAFASQGFEPAFFCENNEFCRSILKRHWPEIQNSGDIRELDSASIPEADVWTAGFPCQDLSLARTPHGKRSGLSGLQSGLFYTFLELVSLHKPRVVLLENVSGLLNSHKGADFNTLVNALGELGYAVSWRVLNARYFGAPQSRPRVFVCAWYKSPQNAVSALYENDIFPKPKQERLGFLSESRCLESGLSVPHVSFCISATSGRHTGLDWARTYVTYRDSVRRLTPLECERLQGFPDNWTLPDSDYVIPMRGIETNRYHAIGNAVCVPVVEWIASRIYQLLKFEHDADVLEKNNDTAENCLPLLATRYLSAKPEYSELNSHYSGFKWKSGGIAYNGVVSSSSVSPSPNTPVISYLINLIEKGTVHEKYFLSVNAIQGIIRRVDKLGRNLFPPMDEVLREIALSAIEIKPANLQVKHKLAIP